MDCGRLIRELRAQVAALEARNQALKRECRPAPSAKRLTSSAKTAVKHTLVAPYMLNNHVEISIHSSPPSFVREITRIFPDTKMDSTVLAIVTMQNAAMDLVRVGEKVEDEKDRLLENVRQRCLSAATSPVVTRSGHWIVHGFRQGACRRTHQQGLLGRLH